jgi:hypothetical protein
MFRKEMLAIDDVPAGNGRVKQHRPRLETVLPQADVAIRTVEERRRIDLDRAFANHRCIAVCGH